MMSIPQKSRAEWMGNTNKKATGEQLAEINRICDDFQRRCRGKMSCGRAVIQIPKAPESLCDSCRRAEQCDTDGSIDVLTYPLSDEILSVFTCENYDRDTTEDI